MVLRHTNIILVLNLARGEGTWISYWNRKYTEFEKIEKRLQCRNNGTVWPTVKSINWGLKLEVFNKEVIENGLICMD